jgi:DNA-binding NarL/FixJ family response regulator
VIDRIRLGLVDDHPAIATAIHAATTAPDAGEPAIELVGSARTPESGIELVRRTGPDAPDVILCDVQLRAGTDGLAVIEAAQAAGCRVIVRAVRTVAAGGTAFSAATLDAARYAPRPPSGREIAVLQELNTGATSDEIGARLGISSRTVESHLRRLFDRYGVVSRTELAVLSVHEGWIDSAPA